MRRSAQAVIAVGAGALVAAGVYGWLWASFGLLVGVFVAYAFGAWAFADGYGDWPEPDGPNWAQAAFPAFAMTVTLFGIPMSLPDRHRVALGVLVFGAAYGGIFLGVAWAVDATHSE
ncbi:hypothetical protein [Halobacterium zhouii]|uniref:hypothetical protein n=1 Tax=Halobacterium zhouii TaxID=2902624 RepID=UPI001E5133F5|nr:hypothetical protein [Halobacterium zhouii]